MNRVTAAIIIAFEVTSAFPVASNMGGTIPNGTGNRICKESATDTAKGHQMPPNNPTKTLASPPSQTDTFNTGMQLAGRHVFIRSFIIVLPVLCEVTDQFCLTLFTLTLIDSFKYHISSQTYVQRRGISQSLWNTTP